MDERIHPKISQNLSCAQFVLLLSRWPYGLCCRSNTVRIQKVVRFVRECTSCPYSAYLMSRTSVCGVHITRTHVCLTKHLLSKQYCIHPKDGNFVH